MRGEGGEGRTGWVGEYEGDVGGRGRRERGKKGG